jgi:hypothetical protein
MLTEKEYAATAGTTCPNCEGQGTTFFDGQPGINAGMMYYDCSCYICGATWTDHFTLVGYGEMYDKEKRRVIVPIHSNKQKKARK